MESEQKTRVCRNKQCQKVLPPDYKYRYCEACRNKRAETTKKILKGAGAGIISVGGVVLSIITHGKIKPKK
jgi:hypothetical protein